MDAELQAQLAHIVSMLNDLDRKIDDLTMRLADIVDHLGLELTDD